MPDKKPNNTLRRIRGWFYVIIFLTLVGGGVMWLYHSPSSLPIQQVKIDGELHYADSNLLQDIAQQHMRGNILQVDLNEAQAAFATVPWIADAQVRRRLPDTIEIQLTERKPIAYWGDDKLVDSEGRVFVVESNLDLPTFEGPNGTEKNMVDQFALFQAELSKQNLKIAKLIHTSRSAWSIVLSNGITIHLGRENINERLTRFVNIWSELFAKQANTIGYVDMRYKDGFATQARQAATTPQQTAASDVPAHNQITE